jgi:hypothetical protein
MMCANNKRPKISKRHQFFIGLQSDPVIVTSDIGNPGYKQHFSKASADPMDPLMLKCSLIGNPFISRTRL